MSASTPAAPQRAPQKLTDFTLPALNGEPVNLARFKGQVVLVVNVASRCGYTPQYAGLQKLHEEFGPRGLAVLGFPCNDFGKQEPGSAAEIAEFCGVNYGVTFPMFEKLQTKAGPGQSPLYTWLGAQTGALPEWNFGKYLIGRDGQPLGFFPSKVDPDGADLRAEIERALGS